MTSDVNMQQSSLDVNMQQSSLDANLTCLDYSQAQEKHRRVPRAQHVMLS